MVLDAARRDLCPLLDAGNQFLLVTHLLACNGGIRSRFESVGLAPGVCQDSPATASREVCIDVGQSCNGVYRKRDIREVHAVGSLLRSIATRSVQWRSKSVLRRRPSADERCQASTIALSNLSTTVGLLLDVEAKQATAAAAVARHHLFGKFFKN